MRWRARISDMLDIELMHSPGTVLCRMPGAGKRWGLFLQPEKIISADKTEQIIAALEEIDNAVKQGYYAAGYLTYEAAPAFEPAMRVVTPDIRSGPLLYFGLYRRPEQLITEAELATAYPLQDTALSFAAEISEADYSRQIAKIKDHLTAGDIYQANYTIRASTISKTPPERLFATLFRNHPAPYAAYVDDGEQQYVSLSPELFLEWQGNRITSKPMKGTAARMPHPDTDLAAAEQLAADAKNRAENLMITDMVRNDLGRICLSGSISVKPQFQILTFKTVHQMISSVHGRLSEHCSLAEIFSATFPAASITGAPKVRAMEIIEELEETPRGIYTGSIGVITPQGQALFNVAIRTLEHRGETYRLGIGGGIVADSTAEAEWQECHHKSSFTAASTEDFEVLETMLYQPDTGIVMLEEHLERARKSQDYFGRRWNGQKIRLDLDKLTLPTSPARIRMTLKPSGKAVFTITPLTSVGWGKKTVRLTQAKQTITSTDCFAGNKTTRREKYDQAHKEAIAAGYDEAIMLNERGEITEGSISNIFIRRKGKWLTPALTCGVLPGLWREQMMDELKAEEAVLYPTDLAKAETILVGNSVRGGADAVFICKSGEY